MSIFVQDIQPRPLTWPRERQAAPTAAFFTSAIFLMWLASPPEHSMDMSAVAENCARWDATAVTAMTRRLADPSEVGKQVYARSANMWIAEARRYCANGSDARAERYFRRIIGWGQK